MIKIHAFVLITPVLFLALSCSKDGCVNKTVESEEATIQAYAMANGITAVKHSSGMYYQVVNPGTGPTPGPSNTLKVRYTGKLLNGQVFDQQIGTPVSFTLGGVITGWQIGLPLIQKGGTIRLIVPSSLGYGCEANGPIPSYSILYFEIELVDVL